MKRTLRALIAGLAVLSIAGCGRVHLDTKIESDDTVKAVLVYAMTADQLVANGISGQDLQDSMADPQMAGLPADTKYEPYQQDGYTGGKYTINTTITDLTATGSGFEIKHEGDTFVFDADLGLNSEDVPPEVVEGLDARVTVTFPGAALEANGDISGNTVTWTPKFGDPPLHAVGEATDNGQAASLDQGSSSGGATTWLIALAAALAVVGVGVLLLIQRRKASVLPEPTPDPVPPAGSTPVAPPADAMPAADVEAPPGYEPSIRPEDDR